MFCEQNGALEKFLATPELVEMLLPFLNAKDILHLVQSGFISIKILQSPFVWKRFIRRSAPSNKKDMDGNVDNDANRQKAALAPLVDILRMMKGHKSLELDLLNLKSSNRRNAPKLNMRYSDTAQSRPSLSHHLASSC